ncbi:MAG: hypothetical protein J7M13_04555 [Synergistetes bacterium]|nr:hypothetical protein [Synergistota bacterium]
MSSENRISVGFAGLAKNVGKTTALVSVLDSVRPLRRRIALTSIGYDGEDVDNITGLPKPKYFLQEGDLIATARKCIIDRLKIVRKTGMFTPLGEVIVARLERDMRVVLAGPNKLKDLELLLKMLFEEGADLVLVDGAINRVYPLKVVDKLIVSTGIIRAGSLHGLKLEIEALNFFASVPEDASVGEALEFVPEDVMLRGARKIVLKDGINFLLSEDLVGTYLRLKRHILRGGELSVVNPLRINAITVSTFYLKRTENGYEPALVDVNLEEELSFSRIPVVDVKRGRDGRKLAEILGISKNTGGERL